jgi:DNA-binding NarL/FixJ family response regulator
LNPISLIIVDDHPIVVEGLRATLTGVEDIVVIGDASDDTELFALFKDRTPDVILLDVSLPGLSGIEITKILTENHPEINVIILSANAESHLVSSAIAAGAKGYLAKNARREELLEAIRSVHRGEDYMGAKISQEIIKNFLGKTRSQGMQGEPSKPQLSDREIQIIRLITEGLTYKEIGNRLSISGRTVETHKNNILLKLDLKTVADLIRYAIRSGISSM